MLESNRLLAEARGAGDTTRARDLYRQALRANPRNADALAGLADFMLDDERWSDARDLARQCLEVDAHRASCSRVLEWTHTRTGDWDAAARELADCLETTPRDADCLFFWAGEALRRHELARARALVRRLDAVQPGSNDVTVLEARLALADGDRAAAVRLYEKACSNGQEFACHQARDLSARRGSDAGR